MKAQKKIMAVVIGGAFAASVGGAFAEGNPFTLKPLASGYMVADNQAGGEKMQDGKCGTGKCSSDMKQKKAAAEAKAKEGNCSAEMKAKAEAKAKEGNCSAEMKKK
jgi:uncharacterized low-complexity protein